MNVESYFVVLWVGVFTALVVGAVIGFLAQGENDGF